MSNFIHELRLKENLNQEDVARAIKMSRQTFAQKEQDLASFTLTELKLLAEFFNLSLEALIAGEIPEDPEVILEKATVPNDEGLTMRDDRPQITVDATRVEKFKQALLYILSKIGAKPNVGETVIYKILYFIDFDFYELYEDQILGATYMKNHFGPTPVEMKAIVQEMITNEQLDLHETEHFKYKQKKYLPLVEPNLEQFSAKELQHIDFELDRLSDKSAKWLSDFSHQDVPWIGTADGEAISYEAVFYRTPTTSLRVYPEDDD